MSEGAVRKSIVSLLKATVAQFPQHTVLRFMAKSTNFKEFDEKSDAVAAGLIELGISKGDKVALYCVNSDLFAFAYMGIVKTGATVVPINLLLNPREISFILNDAQVKGLIYHEAFLANVQSFRPETPSIQFAVAIGSQKADPADCPWPEFLRPGVEVPAVQVDPDEDVVSILYTSGTTGRPKGVMLSHTNLASNTTSVKESLKLTPGEDSFLVVLPMFHAFASTVGMLMPILHGLTLFPVPKFDPVLVADTIAENKATVFMAVPSMYNVLMNMPEEHVSKFKTIKFGISGGSAMPQALMQRFEERFGFPLLEGDGPTECSPVTCVNPVDGVRKPASVGLPVSRVEMAILDSSAKPVADNEMGEICVRAPSVMKGYYNLPEETAKTFYGDWLRTGDLGYRDEDGYFYIVDRIKDMIIVNGMNIYPRMIEEVLYENPVIQEAAVVGEPDERHGEVPVAYIVLKDGGEADTAGMRAFCRERLGRHQVPKKFHFIDMLPKNAAGKILKRELRKQGELERGVDSRVDA
ncbi:MAG: long-chain fatty acid--CoA ligase [Gammaproteobacteria bacterium]|nr:long-chain fatty acid--CoA ligase [Gammaproteobacteria bacterium]